MSLKKIKEYARRVLCIIMTLVMISIPLVSCAERVKDPVLRYGKHEISLSMYEFMLSTMKGTLARNKYDVEPASEFWQEKHGGSDISNEEYYNDAVLQSCKNYLVVLHLFDEEGLSLAEDVYASIDEKIAQAVDVDGYGSQEKFDMLLSKYGTDIEGLRKIYEIEAKYQAVLTYFFSEIDDGVKEEYYRTNYYRFKQIQVSNFYYEYQTDKDGNIIYFDPDSGKPLYDKSGEYRDDENGKTIVDEYGTKVKFDKDGKILYDKENGAPAPTTDEKGEAIKHLYSKEEMEKRVADAQVFIDKINALSDYDEKTELFEKEMPKWAGYEGAGETFPDGYYLSDLESAKYTGDYDFMNDMLTSMKGMQAGDVATVENDDTGVHVIMRYELDSGKYSGSSYEAWFESFNSSLINKLFIQKCEKHYADIEVITDNLKKAKSIKSLSSNFNY